MWASRWMYLLRRCLLGPHPWALAWSNAQEPVHKEANYDMAAHGCEPVAGVRSRWLHRRTELSPAADASARDLERRAVRRGGGTHSGGRAVVDDVQGGAP